MKINEINLKKARHDILTMTTIAQSGHPAGSLSSLEILFAMYLNAGWDKDKIGEYVIVSNGHISPGVYTVLGHLGIIPLEEAIAFFRYPRSPYEGHIENHIPGIAWSTGNLGQGLSAACGFALKEKLTGTNKTVYCLMGDAEQAKGQVSEARKWAKKYQLNNLIAIIDRNHIQISGRTEQVMNVDIEDNYKADGWIVIKAKGNDLNEMYSIIKQCKEEKKGPYVIVAETIMGHGIKIMEDKPDYHGKTLSIEQYEEISRELGFESEYEKYKKIRDKGEFKEIRQDFTPKKDFILPKKELNKDKSDLRGMWGHYLIKAAEINNNIVVFDCDLSGSVKTKEFWKEKPNYFFESGVMEHNIATLTGALSRSNFNVFWADFGMFNLSEVYNQMRLNDINHTNLNVIATHIGIDVGEDGKTHQEIDYIGLIRNLFGFKLFLPADFNQLQFILDYVFSENGNKFVGMGRSKILPIKKENNSNFYNENYKYEYGKVDKIRQGEKIFIFTTGQVAGIAQRASDKIKEQLKINVGVYHFATPLYFEEKEFNNFQADYIITMEDHNVNAGFGSIIAEKFSNKVKKVIKIGIDKYFYSGKASKLYEMAGLSEDEIIKLVKSLS